MVPTFTTFEKFLSSSSSAAAGGGGGFPMETAVSSPTVTTKTHTGSDDNNTSTLALPVKEETKEEKQQQQEEEENREQQQKPPSLLQWRISSDAPTTTTTITDAATDVEIVIINEDSGELIQTYHAHKEVLVRGGPRKCDSFISLFQGKEEKQRHKKEEDDEDEDNNEISHKKEDGIDGESNPKLCFKLNQPTAETFPMFLDYIYNNNNITTETSIPLYSLAYKLCCNSLATDVKEFWEKDCNVFNCHRYYLRAKAFPKLTSSIHNTLARLLARSLTVILLDISIAEDIMTVADPSFWIKVLEFRLSMMINSNNKATNNNNNNNKTSNAPPAPPIELGKYTSLSLLIVTIINTNKDLMTVDIFNKLTDEKYLPRIHHGMALTFLSREKSFLTTNANRAAAAEELTSLQERCIDALASSWYQRFKTYRNDEIIAHLRVLDNPLLLCHLYTKTVADAYRTAVHLGVQCRNYSQETEYYKRIVQSYHHHRGPHLQTLAAPPATSGGAVPARPPSASVYNNNNNNNFAGGNTAHYNYQQYHHHQQQQQQQPHPHQEIKRPYSSITKTEGGLSQPHLKRALF